MCGNLRKFLLNASTITYQLILNYLKFLEFINAYLCSFIILEHYETR